MMMIIVNHPRSDTIRSTRDVQMQISMQIEGIHVKIKQEILAEIEF